MELDELIQLYRTGGPVMAKLSLPDEWSFTFIDICDQEPNLLEIFNIDADRWVALMCRHSDYKQYCDFSLFTLLHWLQLIDNEPEFLKDIDLWAYPREAYADDAVQNRLRRIAQYNPDECEKLPLIYMGAYQTLRLLKANKDLRPYCNADLFPEIEADLAQHYLELEAEKLAKEIIHDSAAN